MNNNPILYVTFGPWNKLHRVNDCFVHGTISSTSKCGLYISTYFGDLLHREVPGGYIKCKRCFKGEHSGDK